MMVLLPESIDAVRILGASMVMVVDSQGRIRRAAYKSWVLLSVVGASQWVYVLFAVRLQSACGKVEAEVGICVRVHGKR